MKIFRFASTILLLFTVTGCHLGPKTCIPDVPIADNWNGAISAGESLTLAGPLKMWEFFDDPILKYYLDNLASENRDIKVAYAKVCEAYALRAMSAARLQPIIDGRIAYNSSKPAGGVLKSGASATTSPLAGIPLNLKQQNFLADFDALWELDLFGKNRRGLDSAIATVGMGIAAYHEVIVALTAEFGRTYLELRKTQKNLSLAKEDLLLLQSKQIAMEERLNQGLDPEISSLEVQAEIDQRTAELAYLEGEELTYMYQLAVMLGKTPESLISELKETDKIPLMQNQIPVGFPSDLLRRRPDICYAEKQIAQSTADTGAAIADLFPKLTLTGNFGFQNLHLGRQKGEGESWGYGGNLLTPIFHGGSLRANVRRTEWIRHQALLSYEQVVLTALEESESAIVRFVKAKKALQQKENAYLRAQQIFRHTEDLYNKGLANNIQWLDQQRRVIAAEGDRINQQVTTGISLISLYKALGGSWE